MSVPRFTLRAYQPSDLDAMFRLDEACFDLRFRFSRAVMRRFAEAKKTRVLIAQSDGEFAGFAIVHLERVEEGVIGYVVTLDVAANYRRLGLARLLMEDLESQASAAGAFSIVLHVFHENAVAVHFYGTNGYVLSHTAKSFYGDGVDAFVYRKMLKHNGRARLKPGPSERPTEP